jgi:hypothetical protein
MHDGGVDDVAGQQAELHDDAAAVLDYGQRNPDTWTGIKFDGGRLVALFTDPDAHRREIASLVAHPDRVDVQAAKRTEREVLAILAQVRDLLEFSDARWSSFGTRLDVVTVDLPGTAEDVARELHERFGDAVVLKVGAHGYPFPDPPPPVQPVPAPQSTLQLAVSLLAIPDISVIPTGETVTGQVEITNTATGSELAFDTDQPLDGCLLELDQVVGISTGYQAGTGQQVRLGPGDRMSIPFLAGTDSHDLRSGATLPPGRYQLVVTIPIHSLAGTRLRDHQLVTAPIPIDIVAAAGVRAEPEEA